METLEKEVADAILERASESITVDGREYPVSPPSTATLILISELVATMPTVNKDADNVLHEVLGKARDLSVIGKIAATLILGAKRIKERRPVTTTHVEEKREWSWRKFRMEKAKRCRLEYVSELDYLSERILDELTPQTLLKLVAKRIGNMQIADFFELTTSLSAANLTRRTKEVGTASGD